MAFKTFEFAVENAVLLDCREDSYNLSVKLIHSVSSMYNNNIILTLLHTHWPT